LSVSTFVKTADLLKSNEAKGQREECKKTDFARNPTFSFYDSGEGSQQGQEKNAGPVNFDRLQRFMRLSMIKSKESISYEFMAGPPCAPCQFSVASYRFFFGQ